MVLFIFYSDLRSGPATRRAIVHLAVDGLKGWGT
jgi:hypothetical protein